VNPEWRAIAAVVAAIPAGRVASYGQVAALAGLPGRARLVGRVLSHAPEPGPEATLPWQRVVNARGEISLTGAAALEQRSRLEAEGIVFTPAGRIDLRRFGLVGDGRST
jgi:methylated-DNA-protein-cysteine methyltransferase related protein